MRRPLARSSTALLLALSLQSAFAQDKQAGRYLEDALKRYEAKDIQGAIVQLKNALQIDPKLLQAQLTLGKALLQDSNPVAAEVALNEALQLGVSRSEIVLPLAQAMSAQGKLQQMLRDPRLQAAELPDGRAAELLLLQAQAYGDIGSDREAFNAIEQARRLAPNKPDSWFAEVPLRIRAQQFAQGLNAAERGLALSPGNAQGLYLKGTVQHVKGEIPAALDSYAHAIKAEPHHLEALLAHAGLCIELGQFDAAKTSLTTVREHFPRDPRAVYLQALLAEQRSDNAAVQTGLREVADLLSAVPVDFIRYRPQLLMLGGLAHHALNEPQKALPFLEIAVKQQPRSPAAKLLAQILYSEGQVENGIALLENYLRSQPQDAQALALLASGHSTQGRNQKATALMNQALATQDRAELRSVLGLALMRSGKLDAAQSELEKAWTRNPRQLETGQALALLHLRRGDARKAQEVAKKLVEARPNQASFQHLLGLSQAALGDQAGARKSYEAALKIEPRLLAARMSLARLDVDGGRLDEARKRLVAMSETDQKEIEPLLELAGLAERQKQWEEAQRWLEKALLIAAPRDLRADFALVDLQLRRNLTAEAVTAARALLVKAPQDVPALIAMGRAQLAARDPKGARPTLLEASRRAGYETATLAEIGGLQLIAEDLANAQHTLNKALEAQPDHVGALVMMVGLDLREGAIDRAEGRTRKLLTLAPRQASTHLSVADIAIARKKPDQALAALRKAHEVEPGTATVMRLFLHQQQFERGDAAAAVAEGWLKAHPNDANVRRALGDFQAARGQFDAARKTYEAVVALNPQDAETQNNLANVLLRLNDLPAAVAAAERSIKARPGNGLAIDTLAWALHRNGQHERALNLLRDARLRAPEHAEIRYHLGAVLIALGRKGEGRSELQAALAAPRGLESVKDAQNLLATLK